MTLKLNNSASALLAVGIDADDTAIAVTPGTGTKFPTLAAGEWFPLVVVDAAGGLEIMRATARVGDVITVVRAQENTVGRIFNVGARVELRITRAALEAMPTLAAQLLARDGTVAAPAYSHASDPSSGLYRIGPGNLGLALGGAKVVDFMPSGIAVTGVFAASGVVSQQGHPIIPVGAVWPWPFFQAPPGWIIPFGQTLLRATHPALWQRAEADIALGNQLFGPGNGTTTFTVFDCRERAFAFWGMAGGVSANRLTGQPGGVNGDTLGATGGAERVTLTSGESGQKAIAGAPVTINDPGHAHAQTNKSTGLGFQVAGGGSVQDNGSTPTAPAVTNITASFTLAGSAAVSGHNNVQPTIIMNAIMFTGVYS
ncbi:MAG: hypothetical protein GEU95_01275 [Rhizobiales bacterium]|nr:hypothetical protein [Hyphomicrobiales bacterium]